MALQKQTIPLTFNQGIDTKTDPNQIPMGKFATLINSIFTTTGRLTKRNGYNRITTLPVTVQTNLTTFNDNLITTGSNLYAYNKDLNTWNNQGIIQPVQLSVEALVRQNAIITGVQIASTATGLLCVTYSKSGSLYYTIVDSDTGVHMTPETLVGASISKYQVDLLDRYFVISYVDTTNLKTISIPIMTLVANSPVTLSATLSASPSFSGFVANNAIYYAWSNTGPAINMVALYSNLTTSATATFVEAVEANKISVTADISGITPIIWVTFWNTGTTNGYSFSVDTLFNLVTTQTQVITTTTINSLTSIATNSINTILYTNFNNYASPYPTTVETDYVSKITLTESGTLGSPTVVLRSVALASRPFILDSTTYLTVTFTTNNQPTYFLIDTSGNIYMRLAYSNAGGMTPGEKLPQIPLVDGEYFFPYLIKDFLTTVNKTTNPSTGTPLNSIYTQTGANLAKFSINSSTQYNAEIASSLHLTGGQLWMYDGFKPVEHGFQVWPEDIQAVASNSTGTIVNGTYNYCFTYEWTDDQGLLHRSAPSIPTVIVLTGANDTITLYVPTLRLTYKIAPNPVRIVGYRWSVAQQTFYQFTSVTSPTLNDTSVDFVTIVDTTPDSGILGNAILYTAGGVVENIAAPASTSIALFKNRLFLVDAEDQNLLWFSKQVIEDVPVEMSDLLTLFVAPTSGAQGSTGPITALSAMDDKLIIFKRDAIYYVTGTGPDNTGANNDFSEPIFVTSNVGCTNPNSIVFMPNGLMFQSDKGIWLLGRDLNTTYIGADVEGFNSNTVLSAKAIPGTTQVRFILDNRMMLMYDYFYNQWGTFTNQSAISSTLYQNIHTYLNSFGQVLQETAGSYIDGTKPVLMSFTTAWINIAGLQGFERFYFMYLLGTYFSPFKLNTTIAYNYNPNPMQAVDIYPDNQTGNWGDQAVWGAPGVWGGTEGSQSAADSSGNVFEARLFPAQQKCESFQISINEVYDPSFGQAAGQGLALSGLSLVIGVKKGYRTQRSGKSFG